MKWLLSGRLRTASALRSARSRRLALTLEQLEDRTVPSVSTVVTGPMTSLPVATDDWADTDGVTPVTISVLSNDSPSAGAQLVPRSISIVAAPLHGTASVNRQTGEITYTARANFTGTDTLKYTVGDSSGDRSNVATVSVRINRPVAADDWIDTDGTTPVIVPVLANDTDPDGNVNIDPSQTIAFVTPLSKPLHGTATLNADGSFTYQAKAGFTGTDSFRYMVTDDNGGASLPATAYVRVNVPTANDDLASFSGTTPVTIDVLANDTDPDGSQHIDPSLGTGAFVTLLTPPKHGTPTLNPDGSFTYQANAGFTGTDTFRYTVTDDAGATSAPATVTVVGSAPSGANDDFTDTDGTTPVAINVLANDSAPAGGQLLTGSLAIASVPTRGRVAVHASTGTITYTAPAGFTGTTTFVYSVAALVPAAGGKTQRVVLKAEVSVRVNSPVAADDWTDTDGTTPVAIDELANDQDPDGQQHIVPALQPGAHVTLVSKPQHGKVTLNADGTFTFQANPGFTGTDSFRYTVTDDNGGVSQPATVYVRVNVPTAADDFATAAGSQPLNIDVLANDQDPDGNQHLVPTSVTIVTPPKHGQAQVQSDGQIVYTANAGWGGTDTFRYVVSDDNGATSTPATVVVITAVPSAHNGSALVASPSGVVFDVLAVASDPGGPSALTGATVAITSNPLHGTAAVDPTTQEITYIPDAGYRGPDTLTYTITDATGATSHSASLALDVLVGLFNPLVPVGRRM
jgi:large repetitive protein